MASTYISRAATGSVTSSTTFTFSFWIKRGTLSSTQYFFIHENASSHTQKLELLFQTDNTIRMGWYDGSSEYNYDTEMLFRDTSAWYNFVFRYDTTQSTDSNRVRMYVNGEQISYLNANGSSPTYMTQNKAMNLGQKIMAHGRYQSSSPGSYLTGSLSHIHYCDGQSYAPTSFGETDSTTGEWKIKANPSLTYGNNGYFILKDGNRVVNDAGNSSGNFSVSGGTLTKTEDCPSNVFATFMPLVPRETSGDRNPTFSNGNTTASFNNANSNLNAVGSIALKGKYYWETKWVSAGSDGSATTGIVDLSSYDNSFIGNQCVGYEDDGNKINEGTAASYGSSYTSGDIIGTAFDSTTGTMWFSKNGTWQNSATISEIAAGTTANSAYTGLSTSVDWLPLATNYQSRVCNVNFGNGYFGTTAVASAGTNASGNGIFEYDTPTGYTALSTKGLNL